MGVVYIIIVTYNGMQWIDKCLGSLYHSDIDINIILVDNLSTDGTLDFVKNRYPQTIVIETGQNLGFGKANNIGIRLAQEKNADYIFLVNQDVYVDSNSLSGCISLSKKYKEFGILSPMQMNGDGNAFDRNFGNNLNRKNCPNFLTDDRNNNLKEIYSINFVMAAFWLLTKECVNKVGGFDPIFSHYGEDNDYINRAYFHGFKVGIIPSLKVYHDRLFRIVPINKQLKINYAGVLSRLTNIRTNLTMALFDAMVDIAKQYARSLIKLDRIGFKLNLLECIYLIKKRNEIIKSRLKNREGKPITSY